MLQTGFLFGWAKPVPVDFGKLRHPRRDMALVAIAGPMANLIMAIGWALILRLAVALDLEYVSLPLGFMGQAGIKFNILLMVLNLLPILPLDGGRIVASLLPTRLSIKFSRIEPYGFFILLALIATGWLSIILGFPLNIMLQLLFGFAGL